MLKRMRLGWAGNGPVIVVFRLAFRIWFRFRGVGIDCRIAERFHWWERRWIGDLREEGTV